MQDPVTGDNIKIGSVAAMWELFSGWKSQHYEYAVLCASPVRMVDREAQMLIQRYNYSEQFHIPPYPGSFEDQPARWVDAAGIIAQEMFQANKAKQKREK